MKEEFIFRLKIVVVGLAIACLMRLVAYSYDDIKVNEFTAKQCYSNSLFDKQMFQEMIQKYATRRAQL